MGAPPGGVRVVDKGWTRIFEIVRVLGGKHSVRVGILSDSEKGGLHVKGGDLTVAEIAAVLEYGTEDGRIPARSFVRATFDLKLDDLIKMFTKLVGAVVDGKQTAVGMFNIVGAFMAGEVKKYVTAGAHVQPENAPSTALRKASTGKTAKFFKRDARTLGDALAQVGSLAAVRPLVDTGRMIGAVTWAVDSHGESGGGVNSPAAPVKPTP